MKSYTITVNGNVYDVTVEENGAVSAPAAAPKAAPKAAPAAKAAPKAAPAGAQGAVTVSAPMPGKILGVKASVGQAVKKGEVLLILEAMKMENEIVAPEDGTVASINVAVGDSVEAGATIATLN
ncbi:acetyl-CoA carboxylase biotin carboxyl carrier protein subunit [Lachnoclostridium sp. An14]|uniref:biotin/lipoyl-containing protein n=1 Tax=Lachnoclostridium sp. An14 TaxID=1965562 RepID=UPI000B3A3585|nr:biotin/lipoyl-containing protein [Lachnoclostridium sp. An14]OUQ18692.1 acetyl-CoA carboxylase biotin carboxyl carrier protein subunit [Lachnoclostridium sp. An14]